VYSYILSSLTTKQQRDFERNTEKILGFEHISSKTRNSEKNVLLNDFWHSYVRVTRPTWLWSLDIIELFISFWKKRFKHQTRYEKSVWRQRTWLMNFRNSFQWGIKIFVAHIFSLHNSSSLLMFVSGPKALRRQMPTKKHIPQKIKSSQSNLVKNTIYYERVQASRLP
jgi:hypothetical protein